MLDLLRGGKFEELGVAADLAEFKEGIEDDDLRLGETLIGNGIANAVIHGSTDRFVDVDLAGIEGDGVEDLGFRRELGGDLVFGAAEDDGGDAGI